MPINKEDVVQGKYIMMLLLTLIGVIVSSIFTVFINVYQKTGNIFGGFETIGGGAAVVILFYSIVLPFITKLGVEKARLIFFAVYLVPFLVVLGVSKLVGSGSFVIPEMLLEVSKVFFRYAFIFVPVLLLAALGISYLISMSFYRKREF
jgi:hypothetical protein